MKPDLSLLRASRAALDPAELADVRRAAQVAADAAFLREAFDQAAIIAVTDARGTITAVNSHFCALSGYEEAELIGQNHRIIRSGWHDKAFFADMYRTIGAGKVWHGEICNKAKDGRLYWVATTIVPRRGIDGLIESFTAIRFDITPLKEAKAVLWRLANFDPLTDLPNRRHFIDQLDEALAGGAPLVVGMLDVDEFKSVNDRHGHDAGDELLRVIAMRLRTVLPEGDLVGRLSGDEFAMILRAPSRDAADDPRVAAILAAMREPVLLDGAMHRLSMSIGLCACPADATGSSAALKRADIALYRAKAAGRNRAVAFVRD